MVGALGAGIFGVVCGETVWVPKSGEDSGRETSSGELLFDLL